MTHFARNGFLTAYGLGETAQRSLEGLEVDARQLSLYLDSRGSVSGSRRDEIKMIFDEEIIDEQCRRHFHREVIS